HSGARPFAAPSSRAPRVYRAPGRVNLIGEHTDYNDGFVMPMALDRSAWIAAAPPEDAAIVVRSLEFDEAVTIDGTRHGPKQGHWSDYVRGVAAVLDARGADLLIASDV